VLHTKHQTEGHIEDEDRTEGVVVVVLVVVCSVDWVACHLVTVEATIKMATLEHLLHPHGVKSL